jgi:hypothetical protein
VQEDGRKTVNKDKQMVHCFQSRTLVEIHKTNEWMHTK